jgi:NADH-quinone oxidoreductase subunit N
LLSVGLGLLVVGLAFKIALVPFHQWAPDVYDGALTPLVAFMSTAPKVALIAALFRVMEAGFSMPQVKPIWALALSVLSVLTMTVGNLAALPQRNIKRMLAYSSIAHAGYMVMASFGFGRSRHDRTGLLRCRLHFDDGWRFCGDAVG